MFEKIFKEHGERVATSIVLVAALVITLLSNSLFVIWAVLGAVFMIAFFEANKLYKLEDDKSFVAAALVWFAAPFFSEPVVVGMVAIVIYAAMSAYFEDFSQKRLLPFVYPSIPVLLLLALFMKLGSLYIAWLIVIVALTDIGAYFVGKSIGCTQFCKTSPKKTLEGVAGGIAVGTIGGLFFGMISEGFMFALVVSLLTSVTSVFGDLYESKLKREADVKDSGNIFPGHGGILDRLDGYLFAVIPFYLFVTIN